jgi:hypothetical protein
VQFLQGTLGRESGEQGDEPKQTDHPSDPILRRIHSVNTLLQRNNKRDINYRHVCMINISMRDVRNSGKL